MIADRRPIHLRTHPLSNQIATWLNQLGVMPNAISVASVAFSVAAAGCFAATRWLPVYEATPYWLLGGLLLVMRLLANMFDGMVAEIGQRQSTLGALFNEYPDRLADIFIFVGMGYAAESNVQLGYMCALTAVQCAYVRVLGNQLGVANLFGGLMAKQKRMFALIGVCVGSVALGVARLVVPNLLIYVLAFVALGNSLTIGQRLRDIVREIKQRDV